MSLNPKEMKPQFNKACFIIIIINNHIGDLKFLFSRKWDVIS